MSLLTVAKQHLDQLGSADEAAAFRADAWKRVEAVGLPKRGTETWKYTSIAPLDMMNWSIATGEGRSELPAKTAAWLNAAAADFAVAVFVNGEFKPDLSKLPAAIKVMAANIAVSGFKGEDGFADVNVAVSRPGVKIIVPSGQRIETPILLLRYQDQHDGWISVFNQIEVEANAELTMAEVFVGGESPYLRSELMQVRVAENAHLKWLRAQLESPSAFHFSETRIELSAHSGLHFTQLNKGAHWLRGQTLVDLKGAGAEALVHGLTFGSERQHLDQRVVLSHWAGETASQQLFKGVFKDSARGVLNGKIFIARDAQKVASQQMNHNLLLSPQAEANTKPELEIYADDVKANHGATVGRLDEEKIFYLQSRGIRRDAAEKLLSESFVADVLMKLPSRRLRELAEKAMGGDRDLK